MTGDDDETIRGSQRFLGRRKERGVFFSAKRTARDDNSKIESTSKAVPDR
jgi:hypothetical protein